MSLAIVAALALTAFPFVLMRLSLRPAKTLRPLSRKLGDATGRRSRLVAEALRMA